MKVFERIEEALIRRKKYQAANSIQTFLWKHFTSAQNLEKQRAWCRSYTNEGWNGAQILQREVYLMEETETLEKLQKIQKLTEQEQRKLNGYKEELQPMDGQWWLHKRAMGKCELVKPKGAWIRQFDTPVPEIVYAQRKSYCKARGGCCNYDCGCCHKPLNNPRSPKKYHCSEECPCCIRRRGFRKIPKDA